MKKETRKEREKERKMEGEIKEERRDEIRDEINIFKTKYIYLSSLSRNAWRFASGQQNCH